MNIICVHQSADMYGSDRSFLQVVNYLSLSPNFEKITVVLPRNGPLVDELEKLKVEIIFMNLSLLSKTYLMKLQWGKIIFPLFSFSAKKKLFDQYDVVYVNTSVILDFYLLAPFLKQMKIIHIREIPNGIISKVLSFFLKCSKAKIIFNSQSTLNSFSPLAQSLVIHNAFEGFAKKSPAEIALVSPEHDVLVTGNESLISERETLTSGNEITAGNEITKRVDTEKESAGSGIKQPEKAPLKILLIGRINSWKGQDFAIEALSGIPNADVLLRIVGSTSAGNEEMVQDLKKKVKQLGLTDKVEFMDFVRDTAEIYSWSDVAIVPSTRPEPFGRIAIEAMSLNKPVIAANHGGLPEIIEHGYSGFLFEPNNKAAFIKAISQYIDDPELLKKHGRNAKMVFEEKFSLIGFYKKLDEAFKKESA
ncbi:glycosyltransferase family 4 protein [Pedobacter sp. PLR]|uniref:glycosyltransferase family 4 protein n=1 Tax=Pedobacter sp. PLR TaxID=2994465 RepID=UPI002245B6EC|nr:glycosyltransferase family 4 protein [Pedobacter sp. PLR]MCX2453242.1 glycosyltransferase family 4 protein [Pedobacter sp. PLR]